MTSMDVSVSGSATAYVAATQNHYYGEDCVEIRPVPAGDLATCRDGRFVPPTGFSWTQAEAKLREHRVLVLVGDIGNGRRTAALRQLREVCEADQIFELEPVWSRPRVRLLPPPSTGCGYILDMSDPTAGEASEEFGRHLLDWAQGGNSFLVVITTKSVWSGRLTAGARNFTLQLESPDARQLVRQELKAAGFEHRLAMLENDAFDRIWRSSPKVEDACRLADIIARSTGQDLQRIVDEYSDWRAWIDDELPSELGIRTLFWSCAFCDGGRRVSVLSMSDSLRRDLNELRNSATILAEDIASKRLRAAKIERDGDRVRLARDCHGLPSAVRRHLWDEFETEQKILANWALKQIYVLPADDAERVARSLLDLALYYRDSSLLRRIRDALAAEKRWLAVRVFSDMVLDPRYGAYVRGCLYRWLAHSPSQDVIDLVAEICGGRLGIEKPDMALVRLQRAALKSTPDNKVLADAFTALAECHPGKFFPTISTWFSEFSTRGAAIVAFLGLASTDAGVRLLCGERGAHILRPVSQEGFAAYFRAAFANPETQSVAELVMKSWSSRVDRGLLPKDPVVAIFGISLAPWIEHNVMRRFIAFERDFDVDSFWGGVFLVAARQGVENSNGSSTPGASISPTSAATLKPSAQPSPSDSTTSGDLSRN